MSKKLKYIPITILLLIILMILIGPIFVKFDPNFTDLASIAKNQAKSTTSVQTILAEMFLQELYMEEG